MQPRKLPIQSNHVPFNLYAKRSIEHIVILIDRIDGLRYGTSAIRLYAFPGNFQARIEPGKIYLVGLWHPLPSCLFPSLALQRFRRFAPADSLFFHFPIYRALSPSALRRALPRGAPLRFVRFVCKNKHVGEPIRRRV